MPKTQSMPLLSNTVRVLITLYLIATWSSMAGMEIFGWLTFIFTLAYYLVGSTELRIRDFTAFYPWKTLLSLFVITVLGVLINAHPKTDAVFDIGSQRWMLLLATHSMALALWFPSLKGYRVFLTFTSLVAAYGIFQSITGIDLMRPGTNRAVLPLNVGAEISLWRTSGLFSSPLQYGYIAGQWVCLPLAMGLLLWHDLKRPKGWLFWGSAAAYVLISLSIVTTFTRGAWVAMAAAHLTVAAIVSRKLAGRFMAIATAALAVLFLTIEQFRNRIFTFFDPEYSSNSERWFLWRANFEMFKDYPILGVGYQENEPRAAEYVARLGNPDAFTGHAHSNYLQMLAGTGITGFIAYMSLISFMLWLTWRLWKRLPKDLLWPRALTLGALGAQVHLHVGGLTECNFKTGATNHNFMVVWAIVIALSVLESKGRLPAR